MADKFLKQDGGIIIYPFTLSTLRKNYPNVSFPRTIPDDVLQEYGIFRVHETQKPGGDVVTEITPEFTGGKWQQAWSSRSYTQEERAVLDRKQRERDARDAIKGDAQVKALLQAGPDQINQYIDNNVTDLSSAKQVIAAIARAVAVTAQGTLR